MTDHKRPPASENMIGRSRDLRQDMTIPERLLWGKLRDRRLAGVKFRRQHPVGPYVADYYCPAARLVIKLDGRSHIGQEAPDRERQDYLEGQGMRVIRFSNDKVIYNLAGVLKAIAEACEAVLPDEEDPA
jgi:very-short-patch-repair endonuclease